MECSENLAFLDTSFFDVISSKSPLYYCHWDTIEPQIVFRRGVDIGKDATDEILTANKLFYTAPAEKMTRVSSDIHTLATRTNLVRTMHLVHKYNQKETYASNSYEGIDLIIIDEIDRLKLQHLEQLRDIYDKNDLALVLVGMPGIEKRLSRYPQLYSRIGFAHEFDNLSKDETHHILEYKWADLGIEIKLEDFSDYEAITTIIKITKGNFRLIHRLFAQIDRILRINQLDQITVEVVEAARDSLVIGI